MEKRDRILNPAQRSFKIFRLQSKTGEYLTDNMKLTKYNGVAFMPLLTERENIGDLVKKFFGTKGYARYLSRYLFTKKIVYQPSLVAGKVQIINNSPSEIINSIERVLPNLKTPPNYRYIDSKNLILDYSEQFKLMFPTNTEFLTKPNVLNYAENIYPELITRFGINYNEEQNFKYTMKYSATLMKPALNMSHTSLIVPVEVDITDNSVAQYLLITKKLPRGMKTNPRTLKVISILRYIYKAYAGDLDERDPVGSYFINSLKNADVKFLIYNKKFAFAIDFDDLKSKKITSRSFFSMFKSRLISLISNNIGIESDESIDNIIIDEDKEDSKNPNEVTVDMNISKDSVSKTKEVNNKDIVDDVDETNTKKINKLLVNSHKKYLVDKKESNISIVAQTDEVVKMMTKASQPVITRNIVEPDEDKIEIEDDDDEVAVAEDDVTIDDDIDEETVEEFGNDDTPISEDIFFSSSEISDDEKRELLKKINKKQTPNKSPKQLRRIAQVKDKYKSIKLSDNRTIEQLLTDVESTQIEVSGNKVKSVIDKSIADSSLIDIERSYIKKTMKQDIFNMVKSFSNNDKTIPLHIIDYDEVDTSDRFNSKKTLTFTLEDENQKRHKIKVDMPIPNDDGVLFLNGGSKVLKKQIIPLPIVKIGPDRLAITTNFNKLIMFRQGTVFNKKIVVIKKLIEEYLIGDTEKFALKRGNNSKSNKDYITTIEYDELSKSYHKITLGPKGHRTVFYFNQKELREEIINKKLDYKFDINKLPIGIDYENSTVLDFSLKETKLSVGDIIIEKIREKNIIPNIDDAISKIKAPKRRVYTRLNVRSVKLPLVTFLGVLFGLRNVMIVNNLKYDFTSKPIRGDTRLSIRFKDGYLYYDEYPLGNSLLFNGLAEMKTEDYAFDEFEDQLPYVDYVYNVLRSRNILKGFTATRELFIDEITRQILVDLNLPTDFLELLLYANELLTDNEFTDETNASSYRIRGYEMLSVALYKEIGKQYEILKQKGAGTNASLSIPPDCIIRALVKSQILENYDTINPINELKSKSACTYKGVGLMGSSTSNGSNSFPLHRRAFGKDAVGIFAESNLDNHQVGISKELTMNPNFVSTRGYLNTTEDKKEILAMPASRTMSPDELICPDVTKYDHPNRVGFSSGQWKHTLGVSYNCMPMIGTGYEKVLAYQIGETFVRKAKNDGKIIDINEKYQSIIIEYKNGEREVYHYGRDFIKNSNFYLENNLELNVKIGQTVKQNDVLAYAKEFFIKQGTDIVFTNGVMTRVALMDDYFTEEDSSLVSTKFSNLMANQITKKKQKVISGTANIIRIVEEGTHVLHGDPLLTFEDSSEGDDNINEVIDLLGDADEDALNSLSHHTTKANATGEVSKIVIYWTGELEEMSESCRKLVKNYIKVKKEAIGYEEKVSGKESNNSYEYKKSVPVFNRINGEELPEKNGILIEFFITHKEIYGTGDKLSTYPALKAVTAETVPEHLAPYTESGDLDMATSLIGMGNRKIISLVKAGSMGKLLYDMSIRIAEEYFS
jgi:hypothetical protein